MYIGDLTKSLANSNAEEPWLEDITENLLKLAK